VLLQSNIFVEFKLYLRHVYSLLARSDILNIGYRRMLLSFENGVNFFQCFAFGFYPIEILDGVSMKLSLLILGRILTMITKVTISHEPLMMYVFHPMLLSAMGITNVRSKLKERLVL
jgi:hypothetical protein